MKWRADLDQWSVFVARHCEVEVECSQTIVDVLEDRRVAERSRHTAFAHERILERKSACPLLLAAFHELALADVDDVFARVVLDRKEATHAHPQRPHRFRVLTLPMLRLQQQHKSTQ